MWFRVRQHMTRSTFGVITIHCWRGFGDHCLGEKDDCVIGPLMVRTPGQASFPSNQMGEENMQEPTREAVTTRHNVTKLKPRRIGSLGRDGVGQEVSKHMGVATCALDGS